MYKISFLAICIFSLYLNYMNQTINATQVRNQFTEIINRILYKGEEFIVEKKGKPVAKIIAIQEEIKEKKEFKPPIYNMGGAKNTFSRDEIYD